AVLTRPCHPWYVKSCTASTSTDPSDPGATLLTRPCQILHSIHNSKYPYPTTHTTSTRPIPLPLRLIPHLVGCCFQRHFELKALYRAE
ncbi:unnamed protein product, partial [Closterium sp. Yama58-4]